MLHSVLAPASPMTETLDQIIANSERTSLITERFHFHKRDQATGKLIADYVAELSSLASRSSFARDYPDDTLRNRFVCELRSERIQTNLLSLEDLSLANAVRKRKGWRRRIKTCRRRSSRVRDRYRCTRDTGTPPNGDPRFS